MDPAGDDVHPGGLRGDTRLFRICRFIPESPRWLLSQNRKSRAVAIMEEMAKENKRTLSKNIEVNGYMLAGKV